MTYLVFPTQADAIAADQQIARNFNLSGDTTRYQSEQQAIDGRWYFPKPPQVVLRFPPMPNAHGGFDEVTQTRDPLWGVADYEEAESVESMPEPTAPAGAA